MSEETFENTNGEYLAHYGVKYKSGRYPWGSGENPFQHDPGYKGPSDFKTPQDFIDAVDTLKKDKVNEKTIAKFLGMSTTELRAYVPIASIKKRNEERAVAIRLRNEGLSLRDIAKEMGYDNDSSIRQFLKDDQDNRKNRIFDIAKQLKEEVDKNGVTDVGEGVASSMDISQTQLDQALTVMAAEYGYHVMGASIKQLQNKNQNTTMMVVGPPQMQEKDLYHIGEENYDGYKIPKINTVVKYGVDNKGNDILKPKFAKPESIARNRVGIRYKEDGGTDMDGVIEIRPGVKDLNLGDKRYAQVRIAVRNTPEEGDKPAYYLKGMAVYSNDLPKGVDILVNSNKSNTKTDAEVFKPLKLKKGTDPKDLDVDWENPFGASIKEFEKGGQDYYKDENGVEHLGLINRAREEGDWNEWAKRIPSQFLSKQSTKLIKHQLEYSIADKRTELEEISSLTNPAVKEKMLMDFAGQCDTQAKKLYAAAFPRQRYQVILPVKSLKDNEVYAPGYKPGEKVALIRFPHAGTFEIPILTVNNSNQEGVERLGKQSLDAIGINSNVAGRLSGADFDGDTVIVIPLSEKVNVKSTPQLPGMAEFTENFHDTYAPKYKINKETGDYERDANGDKIIITKTLDKQTVQKHMGIVSNMITDMTLAGAPLEDIVKAVRHSMVVIDSPKHKLDYKQSEIDNDIDALKEKYMRHEYVDPLTGEVKTSRGASSIISRASASARVYKHRGQQRIDPETGEKYWPDDKLATRDVLVPLRDEQGKIVRDPKTNKPVKVRSGEKEYVPIETTWMDITADAKALVKDPNNIIETSYAEYANALKSMANEARKEAIVGPKLIYSPEANKKYAVEVADLMAQMNEASKNKPRERQAQTLANIWYAHYIDANGELDKEDAKKIKDKMLKKARAEVGAARVEINISDKQWEAIQAGAISHSKLMTILSKADQERFYSLALPKETAAITPAKETKIRAMIASGFSISDIVEGTKLSRSTIEQYIKDSRKENE